LKGLPRKALFGLFRLFGFIGLNGLLMAPGTMFLNVKFGALNVLGTGRRVTRCPKAAWFSTRTRNNTSPARTARLSDRSAAFMKAPPGKKPKGSPRGAAGPPNPPPQPQPSLPGGLAPERCCGTFAYGRSET